MIDKYFEHSQNVKKEIEKNECLLNIIKETFDNPNQNNRLGFGSANAIYYIGKIKTGLHLALRKPLKDVGTKESTIEMYSDFYKVASGIFELSKIDWHKIRPVDFVVGVIYNQKVGLLVEDISQNRRYSIKRFAGLAVDKFEDNKFIERIGVDLDDFGAWESVSSAMEIYLKKRLWSDINLFDERFIINLR